MKKTIIITLIGILVIAVTVTVIIYNSNPLRKSNEEIRESILEVTPIGTSMEDVIKVIANNQKWEINHINNESGYGISKDGIPGEGGSDYIGKKSIRVHLGSYRNIFHTGVLAYFGFDENSELIDIAVRKDTDAL